MTMNGSFPDATASGKGASSGGSWERSFQGRNHVVGVHSVNLGNANGFVSGLGFSRAVFCFQGWFTHPWGATATRVSGFSVVAPYRHGTLLFVTWRHGCSRALTRSCYVTRLTHE